MGNTVKARAMRLALQTAKTEYGTRAYPLDALADVIAYLTVKVEANQPVKPEYWQLPMFAIAGRLTGKLKCNRCKRLFGDTDISPTDNWRLYLALPSCPHCGHGHYTDTSQ